MSKKRATSGGKTHNQKAGVRLTFHFQKTSLFFGTSSKDSMDCSLSVLCTQLHRTHTPLLSSGSEATPHACTVLMDT